MSERQEFNDNVNGFTKEDRQLERLLASLVPRETRVNRDRLMFLAGQASAGTQKTRLRELRRWTWPTATACSACLGLFVGLFFGHVPAIPTRPVVDAPRAEHSSIAEQKSFVSSTPSTTGEDTSSTLITLENHLLSVERDNPSRLADALGTVTTASHPLASSTYSELLHQLLAERS